MGALYKRAGSENWMMAVTVAGRQRCKSTHTSNKRLADQLLSRWETEVFEGRYYLPSSNPPIFEDYAKEFLKSVQHPNTRRRYAASVEKLKKHFAAQRISDVTGDGIEEYKQATLGEGVEPATINHDLRVLRSNDAPCGAQTIYWTQPPRGRGALEGADSANTAHRYLRRGREHFEPRGALHARPGGPDS